MIDDRTIEKNTGLTAEAIRLAATWDSIDDPTIRRTIREFSVGALPPGHGSASRGGGRTVNTHTPGPWHVQPSDHPGGLLIKPIPGQVVAQCDEVPEMEANAKLIAASPDLLAALKRYVDDHDRYVDNNDGHSPEDDMPDAGCIECTIGTTPNHLNIGLCRYHQAKAAIAKAGAA